MPGIVLVAIIAFMLSACIAPPTGGQCTYFEPETVLLEVQSVEDRLVLARFTEPENSRAGQQLPRPGATVELAVPADAEVLPGQTIQAQAKVRRTGTCPSVQVHWIGPGAINVNDS